MPSWGRVERVALYRGSLRPPCHREGTFASIPGADIHRPGRTGLPRVRWFRNPRESRSTAANPIDSRGSAHTHNCAGYACVETHAHATTRTHVRVCHRRLQAGK